MGGRGGGAGAVRIMVRRSMMTAPCGSGAVAMRTWKPWAALSRSVSRSPGSLRAAGLYSLRPRDAPPATGTTGRHVVDLALDAGDTVSVLARSPEALERSSGTSTRTRSSPSG
ncbi:hypothetical protein ACIQNT_06840 [Streptomyces luteogriseus]|uniref:hypothetical protein n=1 Tax=Streptomyces luteogriseus TaxID=68233 RepID=UPI0038179EEE